MTAVRDLPCEVEAVFREFRTCEMTTLSKDGTPITWPIEPLYQPEKGRFFSTTSIGMAQKALNLRRNPKISLLFSTPTGSGLVNPPAVLVQGNAQVSEEIYTSFTGELAEFMLCAFSRVPVGEIYSSTPVMRFLFDWFFMRLTIDIIPNRVLWWDHADFNLKPQEMEICHVD